VDTRLFRRDVLKLPDSCPELADPPSDRPDPLSAIFVGQGPSLEGAEVPVPEELIRTVFQGCGRNPTE